MFNGYLHKSLKGLCSFAFVMPLINFSVWADSVFAEKATRIVILANSNTTPYQDAISGFKNGLSRQQNVVYSELFLGKTQNNAALITKTFAENRPDLVCALGGTATKLTLQSTKSIPVVSTMVMKPNVFTKARNVTGVYLNFPLATQFQWLENILPGYRQVAVLYNPDEKEENIKKAKKIAKQRGVNLIAIPVETAKQLPYALEQLANNVQALLAIPDQVAMSSKTAQAVLLASFRNRVPFIGLSNKWIKAGALYALAWDYKDLRRQCAT